MDIDRLLQDWLDRYNRRRRNHEDYIKGRIPNEILEAIG